MFADLGFRNADDMLTRAHITHSIYSIIKQRDLKQKAAAEILGLKQPDVLALINGKFLDFSVERLLNLLVRLDQEIKITIKPAPKGKRCRGIYVHAA